MCILVTLSYAMRRAARWMALIAIALGLFLCSMAQAQEKKPNILVIFGDDIGQSNISAYTFGLMGYKTPNIDRLAKEGMLFTDYYDLRADPYERADITSNTYYNWFVSQPYLIFIAQEEVATFLATFKEFPPSQRAQSFTVDQIIEKMQKSLEGARQ